MNRQIQFAARLGTQCWPTKHAIETSCKLREAIWAFQYVLCESQCGVL